jgi:hypothetical protein
MGGGTGKAGAMGGAYGAPAGGVGPVLPQGQGMDWRRMAGAGGAGLTQAGAPQQNQQEQMINQLAMKGPPPAIQPMPFEGNRGVGAAVGKALTPPQQTGVLPQPLRMPMMPGERLTKPPMPGVLPIGQALGRM